MNTDMALAYRAVFTSTRYETAHPVVRVHPESRERELHRVTVAGTVPAGVDGTESHIVSGDAAAHYTPAVA